MSEALNIVYAPTPTLERFHRSGATVRGVMGHMGGGKTVGLCNEIKMLAQAQEPGRDKVRRNRWMFVRNTYGELEKTTIKTWLEWVGGEALGRLRGKFPIEQRLRWAMPDGTEVDLECQFVALDLDTDAGKLKSWEVTSYFFNELSEISYAVFKMALRRIGRFPKSEVHGVMPTWPCIIWDSNPPDMDHWMYRAFEQRRPRGYEIHKQPPAAIIDPTGPYRSEEGTRYRINPECETLRWLGEDYFARMIEGQPDEEIKVYVLGEYGMVASGLPVYGNTYNDATHYSSEGMVVYEGLPLLFAFDFGLTPACVIAQFSPAGQLRIIDELYEEGLGIEEFLEQIVVPHLAQHYPWATNRDQRKGWGDPAGRSSQTGKDDCFAILRDHGFDVRPSPDLSNDFRTRKAAVEWFLGRSPSGRPALLIGPKAHMIRQGFLGKYRIERKKGLREGELKSEPVKNEHSHLHDALQYLCLGIRGGAGRDDAKVRARRVQSRRHSAARTAAGF